MRYAITSSPEVALQDRRVGVDAAVTEEGPVAPGVFLDRRVAGRDQDFRRCAGVGDDASEGVAHERMSEELETIGAWFRLMSDAVGSGDVDTVGDRMRALDRPPGLDLRGPELLFLRRVPSDRGRIEKDVGAEEAGDPRGLRVPLIPADQHTDLRVARLPDAKSVGGAGGRASFILRRIARREVVLLVEERVIRNVHLAVDAEERAIGVDDRGRIAVDARGLPLGKREHEP